MSHTYDEVRSLADYQVEDQNKYEMKKAGELFVDKGNTRSLTSDELDENTRKLNKTADNRDKPKPQYTAGLTHEEMHRSFVIASGWKTAWGFST
ncbi:hypothetical protein LTR91_002277 [Friedmanniomyces endolithicus]|uniref:Uncharacterized protein n=1 Tax=Friedmanniomyces endolithicus TaxID=329885 RepID=A0AAN6FH19_9PEZI|nr:hypothetical protein LTS09_001646 [Friedmanniomyces endolithicus]KAK0268911.1 hypothetical protein LTR35_015180 [Friedmanniomyces endolithicus]KAK0277693.1 hypothetical protein LTS00_014044 [Friedmanniomyces endolithicus]KAK0318271.1 hypothetical protein LTR82_010659 [Friedmanniomyces endolithicus]KAK0930849.1 hypothetical protein LTR57_001232 [Friedmanniomyces endolithicus]